MAPAAQAREQQRSGRRAAGRLLAQVMIAGPRPRSRRRADGTARTLPSRTSAATARTPVSPSSWIRLRIRKSPGPYSLSPSRIDDADEERAAEELAVARRRGLVELTQQIERTASVELLDQMAVPMVTNSGSPIGRQPWATMVSTASSPSSASATAPPCTGSPPAHSRLPPGWRAPLASPPILTLAGKSRSSSRDQGLGRDRRRDREAARSEAREARRPVSRRDASTPVAGVARCGAGAAARCADTPTRGRRSRPAAPPAASVERRAATRRPSRARGRLRSRVPRRARRRPSSRAGRRVGKRRAMHRREAGPAIGEVRRDESRDQVRRRVRRGRRRARRSTRRPRRRAAPRRRSRTPSASIDHRTRALR